MLPFTAERFLGRSVVTADADADSAWRCLDAADLLGLPLQTTASARHGFWRRGR
jgi:hypothetical protein